MHSAFKALAGITHNFMAAAAQAHLRWLERGGLKHNVGGGIAHGAQRSALHARKGHGFLAVGDHKIGGGQFNRDSLIAERQKHFLGARAANFNLSAGKSGQIKHVGWLTQFKQNKIGAIHNVIAGNLPRVAQAVLHPLRTRANFHSANHASRVARARFMIQIFHANHCRGVLDFFRNFSNRRTGRMRMFGDLRRAQHSLGARGQFARQTKMAQAITAIARGFNFLAYGAVRQLFASIKVQANRRQSIGLLLRRRRSIQIIIDPSHACPHGFKG